MNEETLPPLPLRYDVVTRHNSHDGIHDVHVWCEDDMRRYARAALAAERQAAQPVARVRKIPPRKFPDDETAQPPRLTDEQIEAAIEAWWRDDLKMKYADLCRAIERLVRGEPT